MKIAIVGSGNMGGAIARGLSKGSMVAASDITVTNPSLPKLTALQTEFPSIDISTDNKAATEANIIIVAVKPWKVKEVLEELQLGRHQTLISVAAGITFDELSKLTHPATPLFRAIPNTAISQQASMTLVSARNATEEQTQTVLHMFNEMGLSILIDESQLAAATALTSCGIAYVLKYVQAAMQAGTELGLRPAESKKMLAQTLIGAARLLQADEHAHPATEIDKVTTPGGYTIRGLNQLEHDGFPSAVIRAIKASL